MRMTGLRIQITLATVHTVQHVCQQATHSRHMTMIIIFIMNIHYDGGGDDNNDDITIIIIVISSIIVINITNLTLYF